MNEEYEALMRFHILMSSKDVSDCLYAAVDSDGELYCYPRLPKIHHNENDNSWDLNNEGGGYTLICNFSACEFWKETLIEL